MHARSTGPVDPITRQPVQGRIRKGGMRVGHMESACLISHGAIEFMRDRMMDSADLHRMHICASTGTPAIADIGAQNFYVSAKAKKNGEGGKQDVRVVEIPYAMKLLADELRAMNIQTRFQLEST
jgi:DNA-directed RNA polymerase beta subunit